LEAVVLEQLARLAAEPPSDRELEKARNLLEIGVYRSSYSADGLANRLGHYEVTAGDFQAFSESVQKIQEVTAGDVQRVMQHYFRPESRSVIVAQP
jgi:predicted Zn-dependent peptidase